MPAIIGGAVLFLILLVVVAIAALGGAKTYHSVTELREDVEAAGFASADVVYDDGLTGVAPGDETATA